MENNPVLLLLLPFISALLGSYLTYYFTRKSAKDAAMSRFKEEKYTNLVVALQGFVGNTVSAETKRIFFEEQYKAWLYSSDEVVKAINALTQLLIQEQGKAPDPRTGREIIGNIILEMRKDLMGKTHLGFEYFRYTDVIDSPRGLQSPDSI